jgi:hypothetical protein
MHFNVDQCRQAVFVHSAPTGPANNLHQVETFDRTPHLASVPVVEEVRLHFIKALGVGRRGNNHVGLYVNSHGEARKKSGKPVFDSLINCDLSD